MTATLGLVTSGQSSPVSPNITMTNGPTNPNGRTYLGAARTNVLLCQIELDSTIQVYPWGAWAQFDIETHTTHPLDDHTISNVRCYTTDGRLVGQVNLMGGWGSNDGTAGAGFYNLYQTYALNAFAITPGTPTIINIYADLGLGFKTQDTIKTTMTGTQMYNLIASGNYYSPSGGATGLITVNSDESFIDTISKTAPTTVSVHGYGKPSANYRVETCVSLTGSWQTATGGHITSSASGEILFDGLTDPADQTRFFRFVLE